VKSRSSTAFNSEIKDFIAPVDITIANCATLIVKKVTVPSPDPTDTSFAFTETGPSSFSDSFSLKNGQQDTNTGLNPGTYAVSETVPTNWALTTATCSDGSPVTAVVLGQGETVTCTFTNTLQVGAIKVTKTRKHAAAGPGSHPQAGVSFTVNGVTKQTDVNGVACFDGLLFNTYNVTETLPAGYAADGLLTKSVTVDNAATCSADPYVGETVSFSNTPKTDITVTVNSQVDGGTSSTINCARTVPAPPNPPAVTWSGSTGANGDGTVTQTDLLPGTYQCTVVIDP
jgi:hypothetical protein